jgi:CBS-domain-containing membrane protein
MESHNNGNTLTLDAKTAADLMQPNVISIHTEASLEEAVRLSIDKNLSAVPVIDENDHPIGVLSRSDIVAHDFRRFERLQPGRAYLRKNAAVAPLRKTRSPKAASGRVRSPCVKEVMTPVVFSVGRDTAASSVVDALLALTVHRLFVTEQDGTLVGVISSTDVLSHLHHPGLVPADEEAIMCLGDGY